MAKPIGKNPLGEQIKPKLDDPETVNKLESAFSLDCTIEEACFYANISRQTYYDLIEYKPELIDRFTALRNKPVLLARQEVIKGLTGNPEFSMKYLERKKRNEFSIKQEIGFTDKEGNDYQNINVTFGAITESSNILE